MDGFGLLIGHLLGDFIFQNDWMATNKTHPHPGRNPDPSGRLLGVAAEAPRLTAAESATCVEAAAYWLARSRWRQGHLACTVHCLCYTLAVWLCSFWWLPWWALPVCFLAHWPVDRFRLARVWMDRVSGQEKFATGPLAPWSVVAVDNTYHLVTLFLIAAAAGRVGR